MLKPGILLFIFFLKGAVCSYALAGWPLQKAPSAVVRCKIEHDDSAERNLAASICGLAAQALNEAVATEGVWVEGTKNYEAYYLPFIHRTGAVEKGTYNVWQLIKRYRHRGVIRGYVLYDVTRRDNSISLATTLAGAYKGVMIDIRQERKAKSEGLARLYDARHQTMTLKIFDSLKNSLNNHLVCLLKPGTYNNRDYAIAHKSVVYYGVDNLLDSIFRWVAPLSPVIGWNEGPEFGHIAPATAYGLFNTASDWCQNLAMLSVGYAPQADYPRIKSLNPATIDFKARKNYHAFLLSDGDNMQWMMGNFRRNPDYWSHPQKASIPLSFSVCAANLFQAAPDAYKKLVETQPDGVSLVEFGGGYYYPDLFASKRKNRDSILRVFALYLHRQMKRTGARVLVFICKDVSSEAAKTAYKIFAEELKGIVGMIAIQYSPYNGGHGDVYWVKNKQQVDIPVMTATYQLWAGLNKPGSGPPEAVADWINTDSKAHALNTGHLGWTVVHAWSRFGRPDSSGNGDDRGVAAVVRTKALIDPRATKVVSIEELLWRLRMAHDPGATGKAITAWKKMPGG